MAKKIDKAFIKQCLLNMVKREHGSIFLYHGSVLYKKQPPKTWTFGRSTLPVGSTIKSKRFRYRDVENVLSEMAEHGEITLMKIADRDIYYDVNEIHKTCSDPVKLKRYKNSSPYIVPYLPKLCKE
jgi:hypothetical protein